MLHPHTRLDFVNDSVGLGVFATQPIPAGTITWVLDPLDQRIPPSRVAALPSWALATLHHYAYLDGAGDYILCWDFARYVNHSCDPTTLCPGLDIELAVRDILPGEQLTGDYGAFNIEADMVCACGSARCRGVVRQTDFDALASHWDTLLRQAVGQVTRVAQPLWPHLHEPDQLLACATDPTKLPSAALHRLAP